MNHMTISACLTRTYTNTPLVTLDGGPFNAADLTPVRLRWLAESLNHMADLADARKCDGKHFAHGLAIYNEEACTVQVAKP